MTCKEAEQMVMPYINDELTDKELEAFLDHVYSCKSCYEELEIFFTVYVALQKLGTEGSTTYNMRDLLWEDLKAAEKRIIHRKLIHYFSYAVMLAAECLLLLMLIAGPEDSELFMDIHQETEMVSESETETASESEEVVSETRPDNTEESSESEKEETNSSSAGSEAQPKAEDTNARSGREDRSGEEAGESA